MKKNIITYAITGIALILTRVLVYSITGEIGMTAFVIINLLLPSLIIIIANGVINYDNGSNIKKCLLHAVILAMLSLVINLGSTKVMGNKVMDNLIESEQIGTSEGVESELLDELDRQARQKMLEEGLISEDDEIYSEPYVNSEEVEEENDSVLSEGQLTGTWDVQIEKENTLSTITGAILDILLAFIGGALSLKFREKKEEKIRSYEMEDK